MRKLSIVFSCNKNSTLLNVFPITNMNDENKGAINVVKQFWDWWWQQVKAYVYPKHIPFFLFFTLHIRISGMNSKKTFSSLSFGTWCWLGLETATALKAIQYSFAKKINFVAHSLWQQNTSHLSYTFFVWVIVESVAYMHKNFPFNFFPFILLAFQWNNLKTLFFLHRILDSEKFFHYF